MTEQERAALKAELLREIREEMKAPKAAGEGKNVLQPIYNKWCNGENRHGNHGKWGPMIEALPEYNGWKTWECVRHITCSILNVSYLRDIKDVERARRIADKLCGLIVELAKE